MDIEGIDGLWWCYADKRPALDGSQLCSHFLTLLGAMKLHYPLHHSELQVEAGPEVPFVVPKLIESEFVQATVSSVPVGKNTAYPIFYYSEVKPDLRFIYDRSWEGTLCYLHPLDAPNPEEGLKMPPMWGSEYYMRLDEKTKMLLAAEGIPYEGDFDLAPWIQTGKLWWISSEDESLELHNTVDDCPYLNLPGIRATQYIVDGTNRYHEGREALYSNDGKIWMTEEEFDSSQT
ncbi:MAG: hypothetical protein ACFCA4_00905 [Cyanophyceae cyanobacterium]